MDQKTFEGTWEQVLRHESELMGRKVRLTVLEEPAAPVTLDRALAHLIEEAERLVGPIAPDRPSPETDDWAEAVTEKYRRQGFKL